MEKSCIFCFKICKNENSHRNHERLCPKNLNRNYKNGMLGKKGKNQYTYGAKCSDEAREKMRIRSTGRMHSDETKKILSSHAKRNNLGGHTSKKQIHFHKKNGDVVYLQSSYEINFAQILEDLNILWCRPSPFNWIDEHGESHKYYPDFKIGELYIDTKNDYLAVKDAVKIKAVKDQNLIDLRIITKLQITEEFVRSIMPV
jgi:hypothetical protein